MPQFSREELDSVVLKARESMVGFFEASVTKAQRITTADRGVQGPRWVSRTHFPAPPEKDACSLLLAAIEEFGKATEEECGMPTRYDLPTSADVQVQWTGYRAGVDNNEPEPPRMSERAKFDALNKECTNDITIMYMHGGAHYMFGPATRRATATQLSQLTGARCVLIQHRLAPQHAFPCQLLDVLHAYLALLYPPPSSFHEPVDPSKLVLAGDSSGASLGMSLLHTILAVQRLQGCLPSLKFYGRTVSLPMPAGLAANSPGFGRGLPSEESNKKHDILPANPPYYRLEFPSDSAWPTNPPREHIYTYPTTCMNPLVHPMVCREWAGLPPMYISVGGGEQQLDHSKFVAQEAARQGVSVIWDDYELMPHNFPMIMPTWPQSKDCMEAWAKAIIQFAAGQEIATQGRLFEFETDPDGTRQIRELDVKHLTTFTVQQVHTAMLRNIKNLQQDAKPFMAKWSGKL